MFDPDHLSFSGTIQRSDGAVLILRQTPSAGGHSVWEHPFGGSPRTAETLPAAVRRCVERDLGIVASDIEPLFPTLDNRTGPDLGSEQTDHAVQAHPSYVVRSDAPPRTAHNVDIRWVTPTDLGASARRTPTEFSPLLAAHAAYLPFYGGSPHARLTQTPARERAIG